MMNSSSQAGSSSGYQSNFTGSSASLDTQNISGNDGSHVGSPSVSPISKTHSPVASTSTAADTECTQHDLANIIPDLPIADRRAVGCEKKTLETLKMSPPSDYRKLQAEANKAMHDPVGGGYRVPNNRWSGYFFSHTSPGPLNLNDSEAMTTPEKGWNRSELSRPNIIVTSPPLATPSPSSSSSSASPPTKKPCNFKQLYDLLRDSGLSKYIELFKRHELDMSTFESLNEADLTEIGVTAFGARRKMLLIIGELQNLSSALKGKPALNELHAKSLQQYNASSMTQEKW